jgi:TolB-like protein/class 3 adenylate cyclase/cytochrome c-type biogenesis protein CcmH/NrfG
MTDAPEKTKILRRLAAILAADIAGYSTLMGADEPGTVRDLKAHQAVVFPMITEHGGRIIDTAGDGILAEFSSVVSATECAVAIQRTMSQRNAGVEETRRMRFRIGINQGDVVFDDSRIYGDGVNIAARLEAIAEPGGICISRKVYEDITGKMQLAFIDLGEQQLKNIARAVRVYAISTEAPVAAAGPVAEHQSLPSLSIVVLPFANLSNDPDQEYFADGITEDLTTDLSRIPQSFVIARNTAFTYKGKALDVRQIGRELGVRYALEGSVRRARDQVRVNVQLLDAENGAQLWADRFDTDRANLADAQDEITSRLARTLNLQLVEAAARRSERRRPTDPDARDLEMRGWAAYYRPKSLGTTEEGRQLFGQALDIDPQSVDAMTGLALNLLHALAGGWSRSPPEDEARADQLLAAALGRNANHPMARVAMGLLRRSQNRLADAQTELAMAVGLDPNNADGLRLLGTTLLFLGDPQAAIPHLERAIRLNPRDPNLSAYLWPLGQCYLLQGEIDDAISLLRKARTAWPWDYFIHLNLAGALGLQGDLDEARVTLAEALRLKPEVDSLAKYRIYTPWIGNPRHWALREKTLNEGLRRAGFPDT